MINSTLKPWTKGETYKHIHRYGETVRIKIYIFLTEICKFISKLYWFISQFIVNYAAADFRGTIPIKFNTTYVH